MNINSVSSIFHKQTLALVSGIFIFEAFSWAGMLAVSLNSEDTVPGRALRVSVPADAEGAGRVFWNEKNHPFYSVPGKGLRALVAVPLDMAPGNHRLTIQSSDGKPQTHVTIHVASSAMHSPESISFSGEKTQLLKGSAEEVETRLIRGLLAQAESDATQYWEGVFIKPVPGQVAAPFGQVRAKKGRQAPDVHKGVDLRGLQGQPIKAANNGVVLLAKQLNFHGGTVLISHGQGVGSICLHMSSIAVKKGDVVKKGQVIGAVGSSGLSTGPHLHWGMYVYSEPVDPLQWSQEEF